MFSREELWKFWSAYWALPEWCFPHSLFPWLVILYAVDLMRPEATIILRNAKIDMFKGSMRLAVDKWGRVEVTEPAQFVVKEDNNLSLIEYELVNVVEEWMTVTVTVTGLFRRSSFKLINDIYDALAIYLILLMEYLVWDWFIVIIIKMRTEYQSVPYEHLKLGFC